MSSFLIHFFKALTIHIVKRGLMVYAPQKKNSYIQIPNFIQSFIYKKKIIVVRFTKVRQTIYIFPFFQELYNEYKNKMSTYVSLLSCESFSSFFPKSCNGWLFLFLILMLTYLFTYIWYTRPTMHYNFSSEKNCFLNIYYNKPH